MARTDWKRSRPTTSAADGPDRDMTNQPPTLRLPKSRFSFVTEFRLSPDGWIERRTVYADGRPVKDSLGDWERIEPDGVELSRRHIPLLDTWLKQIGWQPPR